MSDAGSGHWYSGGRTRSVAVAPQACRAVRSCRNPEAPGKTADLAVLFPTAQ